MPRLAIDLDGPLDLVGSLSLLVRGNGDRTVRIARDRAWWTTRTADGAATVGLARSGDRIDAEAWGPGADMALARIPRLFGPGTHALAGVADARVDRLARQHPGIRVLRTGSVFDALVAAILEQKVTGTEAHRASNGLVRAHGEPAPGPPESACACSPLRRRWRRSRTGPITRSGWNDAAPTSSGRSRLGPAAVEAIVDLPPDAAQARLMAIPGIGPWTAAEVAVPALGDIDA